LGKSDIASPSLLQSNWVPSIIMPLRIVEGDFGAPPNLWASRLKRRKSWAEIKPELVEEAKRLQRRKKAGQRSLRAIAVELAARGHRNERGAPFSPSAIASMLAS
jgi:hypothetical protein